VVVHSVAEAEQTFADLGLDFRPNRTFPNYDFTERGGVPVEVSATSTAEYQRWWRDLVRFQIADTSELLAAEPYDLVLSGSCMQLCGQGLAAEMAGVPWVSYVNFLVDETHRREAGFRPLWNRWRASLGLPADPRSEHEALWYPFSPQLILYLAHPRLSPPDAVSPSYLHRLGPTMREPPWSGEVPSWLEGIGHRPAVLVSTSSLWQDDAELVVKTTEALAGEDLDVVATVAADHRLPDLPANAKVSGFLPHSLVIPKVSAVVCSAGLGTVTRALRAGVPVVVVPRSGDGYTVARAVVRSGTGIALRPGGLTAVALHDAVMRVLLDGKLRAGAGRFLDDSSTPTVSTDAADLVEALLWRS
jgi:hypothetical protein